MRAIKYAKLKKFIEIQGITTGVAVFLFFVLSLVSWRISFEDFLSSKHHAASSGAIFSQQEVEGPTKPNVLLSASCENDISQVSMSWEEDEKTSSFDVYRNGSELVTGLTSSNYIDDNVDDSMTYLYYVTANNNSGSESSDIRSATTFACGGAHAEEKVRVITFDKENIENPGSKYVTINQRPLFTGTTTIENAVIDVQLHGTSTSFALTNANGTGYWHWTPVSNLSFGEYTMYLTATDPTDKLNAGNEVFVFEIKREDESNLDENEEENADAGAQEPIEAANEQPAQPIEPKPQIKKPVDFSIVVINEYGKVSSGEHLDLRLIILDVANEFDEEKANLNISIVDPLGQELDRDSFDLRLYGGERLEKSIMVSCPLKEGRNVIRGEIVVEQQRVSEEAMVDVLRGEDCAKLISGIQSEMLGRNQNLGALGAFTEWLGWIVIILLLVLLILIFIFMILGRKGKQQKRSKDDDKKIVSPEEDKQIDE